MQIIEQQTDINNEDTGEILVKPHGLRQTLAAFRHRNFRLLWFGQIISLCGTWMQTIAQAWLVLELTHSAWLLGVVEALRFLPIMLFSLFGGVLADRWPKRRVLICTQSFAMIQAFIFWLLLISGTIQVWHIFILAALLGATNALDMPTRQAFVVELVGREDIPNAIALNSTLFNTARIAGPGLGGLLIARLGVAPLFLMNAVSFIAVITGLALMDARKFYQYRKPADSNSLRPGTLESLREGFAYVRRTPSIFLIVTVVGVVSLFGINFNVVLPLFATEVLHAGAQGFGFIYAAFGIGSLLAAFWLAWGNNRPSIRRVLIGVTAFSILEAVFAASSLYGLSLVLIALVGIMQITFMTTSNTTLQTVAPDHLRGRVMSFYMLIFAGTTPIGNLIIGGLAHLWGTQVATLICALLSLAAALTGWLYRKPAEKHLTQSITVR